jgi:prepilin-type N-terminal cleavage/methylation domain-containing protein
MTTPVAFCRVRAGFTILELLSAVMVVAILASLLYPVGSSAIRRGQASKCTANLRQIGMALQAYAGENNNWFPKLSDGTGKDWDQAAITPYLPSRPDGRQNKVFICPASKYKGWPTADLSRTYMATDCLKGLSSAGLPLDSYTEAARNVGMISKPASAILLFDGMQSGNQRFCELVKNWSQVSGTSDLTAGETGATSIVDYRHDGVVQALCADGHVTAVTRKDPSSISEKAWKGL